MVNILIHIRNQAEYLNNNMSNTYNKLKQSCHQYAHVINI
jgi:hypothetical protein